MDIANKAQLSQIAHHNAQILRQIKGMHPPVTQYHNPFPMFSNGNGPKHMMVQTNNVHQHINRYPPKQSEKYPTTQNLVGSSSNVAHTVSPHISPNSYLGVQPPPSFMNGKPDFNSYKYYTSFPGTPKFPPSLMNVVSPQSIQAFSSTTSRIPLLRYVN